MVHINMIAVDGSAMFKYIIKQYGLKILQAVKVGIQDRYLILLETGITWNCACLLDI